MKPNSREIVKRNKRRIDRALAELVKRDLPRVWIGEPPRGGNRRYTDSYGQWVQFFQVCEAEDALGYDLLPPEVRDELGQECFNILAARQGLVTVEKVLPVHEISAEEANSIASWKPGGANHLYLPLRNRVREGSVLMSDYMPDEHFPFERTVVNWFVAKDDLTPDQLLYIENYLLQAEREPYQCPVSLSVLHDLD